MVIESKISSENKIDEYVRRIQKGEPKDRIFDGIPESWKKSIEEKLNKGKNKEIQESEENLIPPQYLGMPSEILEEIWILPTFIDKEKDKLARERRRKAIDFLIKKEKNKSKEEERSTIEQEKLEEIKSLLGKSNARHLERNTTSFNTFTVKNGETDEDFWWYEYRNKKAKEMKQNGQFKWGEERIYFDIPLSKLIELRDLVIDVASKYNVPIAFKHLDEEKTSKANKDGKETRFVANFASVEDSARFYSLLSKESKYNMLVSDRNMSIDGLKLDGIAEYSNGYREKRDALKRIITTAFFNKKTGDWDYINPRNNLSKISKSDYEKFKNGYDELNSKLAKAEKIFGSFIK